MTWIDMFRILGFIGLALSFWALHRCRKYRDEAAVYISAAIEKEIEAYKRLCEAQEHILAEVELAFKRGYALGVSETKENLQLRETSEDEKRMTRFSFENMELKKDL